MRCHCHGKKIVKNLVHVFKAKQEKDDRQHERAQAKSDQND